MGIESDREIALMVGGGDKNILELFAPSMEECSRLGIFSTKQALDHIGSKIKLPKRVPQGQRRVLVF